MPADSDVTAPAVFPAQIIHARTRREWKALPTQEILSFYIGAPHLAFDHLTFASPDKAAWYPEGALDELRALRFAYWPAQSALARSRIEARARQLWIELVERAIGFTWPGWAHGEFVRWEP